jgi:hypothetical protein
VKITEVHYNNRRKVFSVSTAGNCLELPYSAVQPVPAKDNYVRNVYADSELGNEAFTFVLESGEEGSVHLDSVLEFNRDPEHMTNLMLYHLTLSLQKAVDASGISKRELIRRLKTSPAQFYRVLDTSSSQKSFGQIFKMLFALHHDPQILIECPPHPPDGKLGTTTRYKVSARSVNTAVAEENIS